MNPIVILRGVNRQRNAVEESRIVPGTLEQKTDDVSTALDMTNGWHHVIA